MSTSEIPTKPYLLRALYEWCVDNGYTPHLAVKVDSRAQVPPEYVKNGEITLNVGPTAVHKMQIGNDLVEFSARFGGIARQISVPVANVYAIYGRETGHGMTFDVDAAKLTIQSVAEVEAPALLSQGPDATPPEPPRPAAGGRPALRRVK
jgi:stringent starvation protein B